jgi:diacylglycerol kinase
MRELALDWYQVKLFLEHASGLSMDALHVLAGVVLLFASALLLRTAVNRPLPLLIVLVVEMINEASDLRAERWPEFGMQLGEAAKDMMLTMAVPVLIFLVARYRPSLFGYKSS